MFGIEDLKDLIDRSKRKEFMANKFEAKIQPLAADCLEKYIKYREVCPLPIETDYYEKLPFILH